MQRKSAEGKHCMNAFGTHHLVGMLGMGKGSHAVEDPDFKLKGTDKVYVAGASLVPGCGSRNQTVTLIALSLMLAQQLNSHPVIKE